MTTYTLGHSRHPLGHFLDLLARHAIELVVDTRGRPYSRFNPQFNQEALQSALTERGLRYLWRGDRLSGRPRERRFYDEQGRVLWDELGRSPALLGELDALVRRSSSERLALLCAEEDPRRCHRRFLLTPPLLERGVEVAHIRGDGRLEPEEAIRRAESGGQLELFAPPGAK